MAWTNSWAASLKPTWRNTSTYLCASAKSLRPPWRRVRERGEHVDGRRELSRAQRDATNACAAKYTRNNKLSQTATTTAINLTGELFTEFGDATWTREL